METKSPSPTIARHLEAAQAEKVAKLWARISRPKIGFKHTSNASFLGDLLGFSPAGILSSWFSKANRPVYCRLSWRFQAAHAPKSCIYGQTGTDEVRRTGFEAHHGPPERWPFIDSAVKWA